MILCVDIGNSRTKLGWFQLNELIRTEVIANDTLSKVGQDNSWYGDVALIAVSSVHDNVLYHFKGLDVPVFYMSRDAKLPFRIEYKTPDTLGFDRVLASAGATLLHPDKNLLVIDCGTCITYDVVVDGSYLGGAIAPGIQQRLNSMKSHTEQLPQLFFSAEYVTIGTSTESSMHMGAGFSACREVEGMIDHFEDKFGNLKVIITGGDAAFFEQHVKNAIFAAPNLVLHGLHSIVRHNVNDINE
ncbi:MAG: type III pantothenate kinase [Salibacteraceae bacterium]